MFMMFDVAGASQVVIENQISMSSRVSGPGIAEVSQCCFSLMFGLLV